MNPGMAQAHVTAWENRESRLDHRAAAIQLTTALVAGAKKKGGESLTIHDFLPARCNTKADNKTPEEKESSIKAWFMARATKPQSKPNT